MIRSGTLAAVAIITALAAIAIIATGTRAFGVAAICLFVAIALGFVALPRGVIRQ